MTNSLVIDVNAPNTSTMSIDITSPDLLSVEIPVVSGFSLDMIPTPTMTIDFVTGSVKGDKGDPGGAFLTKNAATALGGHRLVILNSDDTVSYASSREETHAFKVIGITTHASEALSPVIVATGSILEELSWSWTINHQIFLATDGLMTQDSSVPSLFLLPIGVAVATNRILINIKQPIWR